MIKANLLRYPDPSRIRWGQTATDDHCVAIHPVQGFFRPLPGANPFDGEIGEIKETVEYKLEVNCKRGLVNEAIRVVRTIHPYEEPLINVIPLANHLFSGRQ